MYIHKQPSNIGSTFVREIPGLDKGEPTDPLATLDQFVMPTFTSPVPESFAVRLAELQKAALKLRR